MGCLGSPVDPFSNTTYAFHKYLHRCRCKIRPTVYKHILIEKPRLKYILSCSDRAYKRSPPASSSLLQIPQSSPTSLSLLQSYFYGLLLSCKYIRKSKTHTNKQELHHTFIPELHCAQRTSLVIASLLCSVLLHHSYYEGKDKEHRAKVLALRDFVLLRMIIFVAREIGILKGLYSTRALPKASSMLVLEEEIPILDPRRYR